MVRFCNTIRKRKAQFKVRENIEVKKLLPAIDSIGHDLHSPDCIYLNRASSCYQVSFIYRINTNTIIIYF